ncbi:MAG: hypothetical protein AB8B96_10930 [Lysobacterales bacterium]
MRDRLIVMLFTLLSFGAAHAGSVTVCPVGCDYSTIQGAVNALEPGGTITLLTTLPHTETDIIINKDVVIQGVDRQQTVVQAFEQPNSSAGRVFTILPNLIVTFRDFTIQNGGADNGDGGGIWIQSSDTQSLVTLLRVNIRNNRATNGGGIFNEARLVMRDFSIVGNSIVGVAGGGIANTSYAELYDGEVVNNYAETLGGGLSSRNVQGSTPTLIVQGVSIRGNRATRGAGIANYGAMTVTGDSEISSNESFFRGGGIFHSGDSLAVIEHSKVNENQVTRGLDDGNLLGGGIFSEAPMQIRDSAINANMTPDSEFGNNGGGLYVQSTDMTLERVQIAFNKATSGGGMFIPQFSAVSIRDSAIYDNSATNGGGGITQVQAALRISNTTIENNRTERFGGGILKCSGELFLAHVTIANNVANSDGMLDGDGGGLSVDCTPTTTDIRNSIIAENTVMGMGVYPDCDAPFTGSFSMIGDPGPSTGERCAIGSMFQQGMIYNTVGDVFDPPTGVGHAYSLPLKPLSLAIDGARCFDADGDPLAFDQRGAPMPVDGDGDGEADCDMGAVEFGSVPVLLDPVFFDGFE